MANASAGVDSVDMRNTGRTIYWGGHADTAMHAVLVPEDSHVPFGHHSRYRVFHQ